MIHTYQTVVTPDGQSGVVVEVDRDWEFSHRVQFAVGDSHWFEESDLRVVS